MPSALLIAAAALAVYAALVAALVLAGRRSDAIALARFIPDCVVLLKRLVTDPQVPRGARAGLAALAAYLLLPIDLIPDFIPVAGQLDDALIAAVALRLSLRSTGPELIAQHWPGPPESLRLVARAAGGWPRGP